MLLEPFISKFWNFRSLKALAVVLVLLWASRKWVAYKSKLDEYRHIPGPRFFAFSLGFLSFRMHIPFLSPIRNFNFLSKHQVYERFGWDITSIVYAWPKARALIWVADPDAAKEIMSNRSVFSKPLALYELVSFYGRNIVSTEGDEWRKHRRIAQPAFSEKNLRLVWEETLSIVNDLFKEWGDVSTIEVDHVVKITLPVALLVIGSAGFGKKMSWEEDLNVPSGHKMTFRTSLSTVCKDLFLKFLVPRWAQFLSKRYRNVYTAFDELEAYMQEMIDERRSNPSEYGDLFSNLVKASDEEVETKYKLSPAELMGNTFIFLLAGHETSAHTLAFTLALLALYPEEQDVLYDELKSKVKDESIPTYDDMTSLPRFIAVLYETLRLFPPVNQIPKICTKDDTLTCRRASPGDAGDGRRTVFVSKDTRVLIHTTGLHYNPQYWKDPETFDPSRFLGDWPKEAFLPFSGGPRICIGRRFFETEGVAMLCILISQYRISVREDPRFQGETWEMKKSRLLKCKAGSNLTLTPMEIPLTFTRRKE